MRQQLQRNAAIRLGRGEPRGSKTMGTKPLRARRTRAEARDKEPQRKTVTKCSVATQYSVIYSTNYPLWMPPNPRPEPCQYYPVYKIEFHLFSMRVNARSAWVSFCTSLRVYQYEPKHSSFKTNLIRVVDFQIMIWFARDLRDKNGHRLDEEELSPR